MRKIKLAWFLSFVLLMPAWAMGTGLSLQTVLHHTKRVRSTRVHYTELRKLNFKKQALYSKGVFIFKAPKYLEQRMLTPSKRRFVAYGGKLYILRQGKRPRVESLRAYPNVWALIATLRALLVGNTRFINHYYRTSLKGSTQRWQLILYPKYKIKRGFTVMRITGSKKRIRNIMMTHRKGGYVSISLRY